MAMVADQIKQLQAAGAPQQGQTPQATQNGGENQPSSYLQMGRATDTGGGEQQAGSPIFTAPDGSGPRPEPAAQVAGAEQAQLQQGLANPAMPTPAMQASMTLQPNGQATDVGGNVPPQAPMFSPMVGAPAPPSGPPPGAQPGLPPGAGQISPPGTPAAGGNAPVKFKDFGALIEQNLGNPSTYDDPAMVAAIDNFKKRLGSEGEKAMAGVDADAAARGLLGGSNPVIDRSKIAERMNQGVSDYTTQLMLDRARTMGQDRQNSIGNAFQFLNGAQNANLLDAQMASLAAGIGNQGFGDLVNLIGQQGNNKLDFGGGGDWASVLGSLFAKPGTAPAAAGGRTPLPKPIDNSYSEPYRG